MSGFGGPTPWGIRSKLILGVMTVHVVLMTLFVMDVVTQQRDFLLQQTRSDTLRQARLTAAAASLWVLAEDVEGMAEVLQTMRQDATRYAAIVSPQGLVLAHTDRHLEGHFLTDDESRDLLNGARIAQTWRSGRDTIHAAAPIEMENRLLGWFLLGTDVSPMFAHLQRLRENGVLYTLAAMVLGALAAWLLALVILRQLGPMLLGVDRLGKNELETPIPIVNNDEIARVARALNTAMDSLRISRESLQREIRERHLAEQRIHFLSLRLIEGNESERKRLGHDLHDELGQSVSGFQFGLHSLASLMGTNHDEARELCKKLITYAEEMGDTISRIATHAWPIALEHLGLEVASRSYADECARRHPGLSVTFQAALPETRLDSRLELTCYRIVQEALSNVTRHSGATHCDISITRRNEWIEVVVSDDGRGFAVQDTLTQETQAFSGIGLIGMHERAVSVGGHMEVSSELGEGCRIRAFLPLMFNMARGGPVQPEAESDDDFIRGT